MNVLRKAVILSAGSGTRLMPLTSDRPKVMLPVGGKPLLQRHLDWLTGYGITQFFINLHAHPKAITDFFGDGSRFGVHITYSFEEKLQGTAGALRRFRPSLDETFLVHYGDVYSELQVDHMLALHRSSGAAATLAAHRTTHAHDSDIVEMGEGARVKAVHHKPGTDRYGEIANAACYLLDPLVLKYLPDGEGEADFIQHVFPPMLADGKVISAYDAPEFMQDMGTHDRYERLNARLGGL